MAGLPFETLSSIWAVASGIAVALLGAYLLRGGESRPQGALPFGLFSLAWGTQIAAINAPTLVESQLLATELYLVALVALFPLPYFLVEFAASQTDRRGRRWTWRVLRGLAAGLALASAGIFLVVPEILFGGVGVANEAFYPQWGPAFLPLVSLSFFAALALALATLRLSLLGSPTPRTRRLNAFFLAGLGLYTGYTAGYNLLTYVDITLSAGASGDSIAYLVAFSALSLLILALGYGAYRRWAQSSRGPERTVEGWIAIALLVPFLTGLAAQGAAIAGLGGFDLVGAWRLAGVGVIAYGLTRRRLYDLPQRVRRGASTAAGAAGATAGGATVFGALTVLTGGLVVPAAGGGLVTAISLKPAVKAARRLLGAGETENPVEREEALYEQRIETYRAALEDSMARGALEEDEPFLAALRDRFDIREREDRILRHYARDAVVVHREDDEREAYDRIRILGEGGAGRTWLARDRTRDRLVVLKEPLERWQREPEMLEAAEREAELARKVRHPNVVEVEEVLETSEGQPIIVMEFVEGGTLADRLRSTGVLGWREAVSTTHDVLQGLAAVHDRGIVHRDIKPSNVLLTGEGRAKLSDFGIARPAQSGATRVPGQEPSGTEAYMAPEIRDRRTEGDERSDVWAAAAVLHTCLHGAPPSQNPGVRVQNDVPPGLEAVLAQGLAGDPEQRFPSAEAFAHALAEVTGDAG